ncbi:MAG: ubiquitin-like domain-containing protein [Streptomycetales bacterium]
MRRTPQAFAAQAVAVATLVGGTTAFVSFDKAITLSVDGKRRTVHTFAATVGDVLKREGLSVGEHDTVAPAPTTKIGDGSNVAIRYGRLLTLTKNGQTRKVWVTATNVQNALDQLGLRVDGAYLSASRSLPIGRQGLSLTVRLPHHLTFFVDGERRELTTTAPTVRQAMHQAGIRLDEDDRTSVPLGSYPKDDATISVLRIEGKRVTQKVEIPFDTNRIADDDLEEGVEDVVREGVPGMKVVTYDVRLVNGERKDAEVVKEKVLRKPRARVVHYGTQPPSTEFPATGAEDLNWGALADCESGGDPEAYNPAGPYYGLYQFSQSTWESVGGSGTPTDASADEQTYRAQLLYNRSGDEQWPVCGDQLYS